MSTHASVCVCVHMYLRAGRSAGGPVPAAGRAAGGRSVCCGCLRLREGLGRGLGETRCSQTSLSEAHPAAATEEPAAPHPAERSASEGPGGRLIGEG